MTAEKVSASRISGRDFLLNRYSKVPSHFLPKRMSLMSHDWNLSVRFDVAKNEHLRPRTVTKHP